MFRGRASRGPGLWMGGRGHFPGAGGFRQGGGFGRGWCRYRIAGGSPHFGAPWTGPGGEVDESEYLKAEAAALRCEAEALRDELAEIENRLAEIEQSEEE